MFEITLTIGIFVIVIGLIYLMERRVKKKGSLFTGQATRGMRLLAILLGLLFAGISFVELTSSDAVIIWFPIIAIALLGYGFGADQWLVKLQGRSNISKVDNAPSDIQHQAALSQPIIRDETRPLVPIRILRFTLTVAVILVVSAAVLYGAIWAATHPNNPLAILYVVGIVILFIVARFFDWIKLLKNLSNLFK